MQTAGRCCILDLPDDCLQEVLAFVDRESLGAFRSTCRDFHLLDSASWAARHPFECLQAISNARAGLRSWVAAGVLAARLDNSAVPAVWLKEVREILSRSPANPRRIDAIPAGIFWTPHLTLEECIIRDSVEGLAFLVKNASIVEPETWSPWMQITRRAIEFGSLRVLKYSVARLQQMPYFDPGELYNIAGRECYDARCFRIIRAQFPMSLVDDRFPLYVFGNANMAVLEGVGWTARKLCDTFAKMRPARALKFIENMRLRGLVSKSTRNLRAVFWHRWLRPVIEALAGKTRRRLFATAPRLFAELLSLGSFSLTEWLLRQVDLSSLGYGIYELYVLFASEAGWRKNAARRPAAGSANSSLARAESADNPQGAGIAYWNWFVRKIGCGSDSLNWQSILGSFIPSGAEFTVLDRLDKLAALSSGPLLLLPRGNDPFCWLDIFYKRTGGAECRAIYLHARARAFARGAGAATIAREREILATGGGWWEIKQIFFECLGNSVAPPLTQQEYLKAFEALVGQRGICVDYLTQLFSMAPEFFASIIAEKKSARIQRWLKDEIVDARVLACIFRLGGGEDVPARWLLAAMTPDYSDPRLQLDTSAAAALFGDRSADADAPGILWRCMCNNPSSVSKSSYWRILESAGRGLGVRLVLAGLTAWSVHMKLSRAFVNSAAKYPELLAHVLKSDHMFLAAFILEDVPCVSVRRPELLEISGLETACKQRAALKIRPVSLAVLEQLHACGFDLAPYTGCLSLEAARFARQHGYSVPLLQFFGPTGENFLQKLAHAARMLDLSETEIFGVIMEYTPFYKQEECARLLARALAGDALTPEGW